MSYMSYKFVNQPLRSGLYEPEGIYLGLPFRGPGRLAQPWGAHPEFYGEYQYNGVAVRGHLGIDFAVSPGARLVAVDQGRVIEISYEAGGFERYIKLEHRWGESFYAHVGEVTVESGQMVGRGDELGLAKTMQDDGSERPVFVHFGIRVLPYNRFDGWGGFSDPLPFLNPAEVGSLEDGGAEPFAPPPMAEESPSMRRP